MYREFQRTESRNTMNLTQAPQYIPDEGAATSLLRYMTTEQLQACLEDVTKLDSIIADLPQMKTMLKDRENTVVKNRSLAEFNMSLKPKFDSLKVEVATGYEEVNSMKMSLGRDVAKLESLAGNQCQDTMLAIFKAESATIDEESEDVACSFCDGNVDIEQFISTYIPMRSAAYNKKAKLEKLTEMIRHGETGMEQTPYQTHTHRMPSKTLPGSQGMSTGYGAPPYPTPYPSTQQYGGMPHPYR